MLRSLARFNHSSTAEGSQRDSFAQSVQQVEYLLPRPDELPLELGQPDPTSPTRNAKLVISSGTGRCSLSCGLLGTQPPLTNDDERTHLHVRALSNTLTEPRQRKP